MIHLVDTHAHLFWDSFEKDFEETITRAVDAGVKTVINVGVDVELSQIATDLKTDNPQMKFYSSIGIHPEEGVRYWDRGQGLSIKEDIEKLEKIYLRNKGTVMAIGECGLDFAYFNREGYLPEGLSTEKAKDLQRQLFKAQIALAKKLGLPLLIHCRDDRSKDFNNTECWDEVIELAKDWKGIYHCYSGLTLTTKYLLLNTDFLVSFAGNLTYPKNDYLKEAVKIVPLEKIVLETDCPFLPPQSIRGKRNEPSSVKEVAQTIADIKGISVEKVAEQTTENFQKLFNI